MSSYSLRDYLTRENPCLDNENSLGGLPTRAEEKLISEVVNWADFNIETLESCYGDVLNRHWAEPLPDISPDLTQLEREIFDEDSFEHLLSRSIVPQVNESIERALNGLDEDRNRSTISMTRGGRARKSRKLTADTSGAMKFPDWAAAQDAGQGHLNLCPGETKLSNKWTLSANKDRTWYWPLYQVTTYCADIWDTRYGYIITQDELVALRLSRLPIGSGIALNRSPRQHSISSGGGSQRSVEMEMETQSSVSCDSGDISAMSVSDGEDRPDCQFTQQSQELRSSPPVHQTTSSSFRDDGRGNEYVLETCSVPWSAHGYGRLTVKLALWWLHMMAAAPHCDISIADGRYPGLDTWVDEGDSYRHSTTGKRSKSLPPKAKVTEAPRSSPVASECQGGIDISFSGSSVLSSVPDMLQTPPGLRHINF
ncbi:hypothetical protein ABOM_008186 [Aspergillus bombycis]|uniref:Uncharacterized protein n=1 Tax=Aspergillus bombycis TaxID=109264 RepID=A0A1F7ZTG7_9EURO|nr:hypothetical protein ABOM_008186 [Aspergillus bombycis]OGM42742.1 hypothetical protein ABOM_008186 [Aspergillus bombycis]